MRRIALIVASILVSAFFLWLALKDVEIRKIVDNIRQADVAWLALSTVFTTIGLWTRGIRWRGLLGFRISAVKSFHIWNISILLNQIPLRAGEVARSLLAAGEGVPVVTAATSIVLERLLDTLLVVVLLAVALSRLPSASAFATQSAALFGAGAVLGFVVLVLLARYPDGARRLLARVGPRIPLLRRLPLERLLDHVIDGLRPLTTWRSAAHAVGWTLIAWTFSLGTFYSYHRAMGIEGVDLVTSAALALTLASFSLAIPVSVGALGPFEAAVIAAGQAVASPAAWGGALRAAYTALGFLTHGMNVLLYAVWGGAAMAAMGVSLGEMLSRKAVVEENTG